MNNNIIFQLSDAMFEITENNIMLNLLRYISEQI